MYAVWYLFFDGLPVGAVQPEQGAPVVDVRMKFLKINQGYRYNSTNYFKFKCHALDEHVARIIVRLSILLTYTNALKGFYGHRKTFCDFSTTVMFFSKPTLHIFKY